ncbi:MAG TPA: GNAT family N-acetyltransferase [Candidatus Binatia bacterium]|jgi:GNAT superfamily N-acetyltransferase
MKRRKKVIASDNRGLQIKSATESDVPVILSFIKKLARYERLSHEVVATEESLRETLFGSRQTAEVAIGYLETTPVGFVLFFHNYSTFLGKPGLYIEDLYVDEAYRRRGYGRALLLYVARLAKERGCGRLEWSVLDWNQPAIDFYKKLGALPMSDWTIFRISGKRLDELADR